MEVKEVTELCNVLHGISSEISPPIISVVHNGNGDVSLRLSAISVKSPPVDIERYVIDWGDGTSKNSCTDNIASHTYVPLGYLPVVTVYAVDVVGTRSDISMATINPFLDARAESPMMSTTSVTMYDVDTKTFSITNYNEDYIYEVDKSDGLTVTINNGNITITSNPVDTRVLGFVKIRASKLNIESSNWMTVIIEVNQTPTEKPLLGNDTVYVNERNEVTINIDNYNPDYTYELVNGSNFTASKVDDVIIIRGNEVDNDCVGLFKIRTTASGHTTSDYTEVTVHVLDIPIVDDQLLVYNAVNMTEFTTLTNSDVIDGKLVAIDDNGVGISNPVEQEIGETDFRGLNNIIGKLSNKNILYEYDSINNTIVVENEDIENPSVYEVGDTMVVSDNNLAIKIFDIPNIDNKDVIKTIDNNTFNDTLGSTVSNSSLFLDSGKVHIYYNDENNRVVKRVDMNNRFDIDLNTIETLVDVTNSNELIYYSIGNNTFVTEEDTDGVFTYRTYHVDDGGNTIDGDIITRDTNNGESRLEIPDSSNPTVLNRTYNKQIIDVTWILTNPIQIIRKPLINLSFSLGNGYISIGEVNREYQGVNDDIDTIIHFAELIDIQGRVLQTKVQLANKHDKLTELTATVQKEG